MSLRLLICSAAFFGSWLPVIADTFVYDDAGRLRSATQTSGLIQTYIPDEESNLQSVGHSGSDTTDTNGPGNGIPDWWENYWFGTRGIDPLATPQGDGVSNLMKYALGLNPLVHTAGAPVALAFQTYAGDGKSYPYLTFIRAKDGAAILTVEQSSGLATWQSGPAYFQQVSVQDLGDGTERVILRSLTPLPGASNLFFRLKASHGTSPSTAYYTVPGATGVPAISGWALACLGVLIPVGAGRYLRRPIAAR